MYKWSLNDSMNALQSKTINIFISWDKRDSSRIVNEKYFDNAWNDKVEKLQ